MPRKLDVEKTQERLLKVIEEGEKIRKEAMTLPKELFCRCKNGKPCFDTQFNIEQWHESALAQQRAHLIQKIEELKLDDRPEITEWLLSKAETKAYNLALSDILAIIKES